MEKRSLVAIIATKNMLERNLYKTIKDYLTKMNIYNEKLKNCNNQLKNHMAAIYAIKNLLIKNKLWIMWKSTLVKNPILAITATKDFHKSAIWKHMRGSIQVKNPILAKNAKKDFLIQLHWKIMKTRSIHVLIQLHLTGYLYSEHIIYIAQGFPAIFFSRI